LHNETVFSICHPFRKRRQTKLIELMHKFTINVIENRRKTVQGSLHLNKTQVEEMPSNKKRMALLDVLLQSTIDGRPLTNADIREEVDTFMFEGHDTTTSAISFALHTIARHPKVQQQILEEVSSIMTNSKNCPPTLSELNDLKYLECVIKEILRMYPSVPIVGRQIMSDFSYSEFKMKYVLSNKL